MANTSRPEVDLFDEIVERQALSKQPGCSVKTILERLDDKQRESLQRAMDSAVRAREEIAGPLRIVGPRSTFQPVLWPLLDEFCAMHHSVVPDVQLDDRIGNWVEDRVDVGFRLGASAHEGVIARRLFPVQLVICAAPAYVQQHGVPESLPALQAHRCSVYRHPATGAVLPWRVKVGGVVVEQPVVPAICSNDEML